jgi:hypothetical protein
LNSGRQLARRRRTKQPQLIKKVWTQPYELVAPVMQMQETAIPTTEYQISVFGSPVLSKATGMLQTLTPLPPVRTYTANKQCQYEIAFPPGSMGLEFEPVITSSERTIGCRVKDYYFGLDYNGIEKSYIEEHIATGDIITKVDNISVVSMPFSNILDLLRSLVATSRTVSFKNITASCKSLTLRFLVCNVSLTHFCFIPTSYRGGRIQKGTRHTQPDRA